MKAGRRKSPNSGGRGSRQAALAQAANRERLTGSLALRRQRSELLKWDSDFTESVLRPFGFQLSQAGDWVCQLQPIYVWAR